MTLKTSSAGSSRRFPTCWILTLVPRAPSGKREDVQKAPAPNTHEAAGPRRPGRRGARRSRSSPEGAGASPACGVPARAAGARRPRTRVPGSTARRRGCHRRGAEPGGTPGDPRCILYSRARAGIPLPTAWQLRGWGHSRDSPGASFRPAHHGEGASAGHPRAPARLTCAAARRRPQEDERPAPAAHAAARPGHAAAPRRLLRTPGGGGTLRSCLAQGRSRRCPRLLRHPPRAGGGPAGDGCCPRRPPACTPGAAASFVPRYGFGDPQGLAEVWEPLRPRRVPACGTPALPEGE